ncbi:hypothetical protein CDD81_6204 [Ophiocordyceps australis]|uniref:Ubiquitin-conjugating enzyme E2 2 n=1 Tax=Ophiocordyceps australis TaxID=1399860 RepID=A0A2C5Y698_9HYPO|nr:hypothetical protein CDD81_6204 [Ophiocordyceps australis]
MASSRDRRIAKELADIQTDRDNSGVFAVPYDGVSLTHLTGTIPAPPDTPYSGGTYEIDIQIPENYPFKAPVMNFVTKIWHPNVSSQTGVICLDTLSKRWSPVQTIKTTLLSIRMLLESPNPSDPQDAEVAAMLLDRPDRFALTAQEWAIRYAGAPNNAFDINQWIANRTSSLPDPNDLRRYKGYNKALVDRFTAMGFEVESVVNILITNCVDNRGGLDFNIPEPQASQIVHRLLVELHEQ